MKRAEFVVQIESYETNSVVNKDLRNKAKDSTKIITNGQGHRIYSLDKNKHSILAYWSPTSNNLINVCINHIYTYVKKLNIQFAQQWSRALFHQSSLIIALNNKH